MDDQTPQTPTPTTPETGVEKPIVTDPHQAEPEPPAQEGLRPEADPSLVRPMEDEPGGPIAGLMTASAAEATAEITPDHADTGAEELLAMMGVEEEGIEAGQIGGLAIAILVSIFALAAVVYFLFYSPTLDKTAGLAESEVRYEELDLVNTEGQTKLTQYARADSAYTLPIEAAMAAVASEYAGDAAVAGVPRTRAEFNTTPVETRAAGLSRQPETMGTFGADSAAVVPGRYASPVDVLDADVDSGEEVGVDEPDAPTPE